MRPMVARRTMIVLLIGLGPASRVGLIVAIGGEVPPALTPPTSLNEPADGPAGPGPSLDNGPLFVIPGVNGPPRVRTRGVPLPTLEPTGASNASNTPPLIGPSERTSPLSAATGQPMPVESSSEIFPNAMKPPEVNPEPGGTAPAPRPVQGPSPIAPRRPPNFLGRFFPTPFNAGRGGDDGSRIVVEPSTDPAAEAALKRRLERQIRETLTDRVSHVEVRVVGRDVNIRARAVRFWQRRAVRRALETLPGLAGYHPTVEILD